MFSVSFKGLDNLTRLASELAETDEKFELALDIAGKETVTNIQAKIVDGGGAHSSPGEYPRSQSGQLRDSISYEVSGRSLSIRADAEYAPYLEYGTSKMASRPFLERGIDDALENVELHLRRVLEGIG